MYETIEEEMSSPAQSLSSRKSSPTTHQLVYIMEFDTMSMHSKPEQSTWDDECGITTLRRYYALRDEAENVVVESKRTWLDTPFSLFALQSACFILLFFFSRYLSNWIASFSSTREPSWNAGALRTFCLKLSSPSL